MTPSHPTRPGTWIGRVARRVVAAGSKSEHAAIVLDTPGGAYVLRRVGANAFRDSALDALVGLDIEARGTLVGVVLLLDGWAVIPPSDGPDGSATAPSR